MEGGIDAWKGLVPTGDYEQGMFLLEGKEDPAAVLGLALSLENGSKLFYESVKNSLEDAALVSVFEKLSKAEEAHMRKLYDISRSIVPGEPIGPGESRPEYMEAGQSVNEAAAWAASPHRSANDILEFCTQIEVNSLDLYLKLSVRPEFAAAREAFESLIEEEKNHLKRLLALLEK